MSEAFRVAVLSSAPGGGAGIAAARLQAALDARPNVSAEWVDIASLNGQVPSSTAIPTSLSNRQWSDTHFTLEFPGAVRGWMATLLSRYDAVNVHWAAYLLSLGELFDLAERGKPVLLTMHDFNYLSGGCHYPAGCDRYLRECFPCPQVDPSRCELSVIAEVQSYKHRILAHRNVHVSAPSRHVSQAAVACGAVDESRAHVLRNAYEPILDIPKRAYGAHPRILLVADSLSERRKGVATALDALDLAAGRLAADRPGQRLIVDVVGSASPELESRLRGGAYQCRVHGRLSDELEIAGLYARADCLLTCSFEDNWPNVLVEAGAYGCVPVVGPGHGCEEFVRTLGPGFIADDYSSESFARAIVDALGNVDSASARNLAHRTRQLHAPERVGADFEVLLRRMAAESRSDLASARSGVAS